MWRSRSVRRAPVKHAGSSVYVFRRNAGSLMPGSPDNAAEAVAALAPSAAIAAPATTAERRDVLPRVADMLPLLEEHRAPPRTPWWRQRTRGPRAPTTTRWVEGAARNGELPGHPDRPVRVVAYTRIRPRT